MVHGSGTRYVKIGKTTNIFNRFQDLQNGVPFTLQLLWVRLEHDMDAAEDDLLRRYRAYRTRGEWHEFPDDILEKWPVNNLSGRARLRQMLDDRDDQASRDMLLEELNRLSE